MEQAIANSTAELSDSHVAALLNEVDELLLVLEARIPANPKSKQNVKLPDPLERELRKYFDVIGVSLPYEGIVKLYTKYAGQEGK